MKHSQLCNRHLFCSLLIICHATADAGDLYGKYTNGRVTIIYEMNNRGGDVFKSSLCKGIELRPAFDSNSEIYSDPANSYAIYFQGEPTHMEIEGSNKCFPEGTYKAHNQPGVRK